jgi:hypothetical protein
MAGSTAGKEIESRKTKTVTKDLKIHSDPRTACSVVAGRVEVDLDKLDLDYQPEIPIPEWKPSAHLEPYEQLSKLYLEIETSGLGQRAIASLWWALWITWAAPKFCLMLMSDRSMQLP